jgi:hypothetical protein
MRRQEVLLEDMRTKDWIQQLHTQWKTEKFL